MSLDMASPKSISENIDRARLLQDYNWFCVSGLTDEAEVRRDYQHKYGTEPEYCFREKGIWWAGPLSLKVNLRRYLHTDWSEVGEGEALVIVIMCAVMITTVVVGGLLMVMVKIGAALMGANP